MDYLVASLPFIKVVGSFLVMLVAIRLGLLLAVAILLGGLILGLVFGLSPSQLVITALFALVQEKFLLLMLIVGLILIFSDTLQQSGQSERLTRCLSRFLTRPGMRLVFFPALIGLLPMPGGAVFSAPMVKAVSSDMELTGEDRAVINYWFRHVWELAWPLYPGIILTVSLAGLPMGEFLSCTWPGIPAMFFIGWFFFLRGGRVKGGGRASVAGPVNMRELVLEAAPLAVAIAGAIGLEAVISNYFPRIAFEWGVIVAMLAAIILLLSQNRLGPTHLLAVVKKKSVWAMLGAIMAIFIFKDVMQAAGVVDQMATAAGTSVALFSAAVFLPFLVGMVAGINVAFVGATFPLLIGLLEALGMTDQLLAYLVLASFSGFTGVMISPIHICFVLTCNFFDSNLALTWRRLVGPCLCMAFFGGLLFVILR